MPNVSYKVQFGESVFDLAVKLYGDVSYSVKLMSENTNITSLSMDLEGMTIEYDSGFKKTSVTPLVVNVTKKINIGQTYTPTDYQTIFDIALMLNGGFDGIVDLVRNSTISELNQDIESTDRFYYTKLSNKITDWVDSTGQIFQSKTGTNQTGNFILQESGAFLLLQTGGKIVL